MLSNGQFGAFDGEYNVEEIGSFIDLALQSARKAEEQKPVKFDKVDKKKTTKKQQGRKGCKEEL